MEGWEGRRGLGGVLPSLKQCGMVGAACSTGARSEGDVTRGPRWEEAQDRETALWGGVPYTRFGHQEVIIVCERLLNRLLCTTTRRLVSRRP